MKRVLILMALGLLIPFATALSTDVEKSKWDWVEISPNHLEFTKPSCQVITLKPTFKVTDYTRVNLEIYSKEYANGVSTGHIFKIYSEEIDIYKSEVKDVMVCAEYDPGSVPKGTYESVLYIESPDRVHQIPLELKVTGWNRFTQKLSFEFKSLWFKEISVIGGHSFYGYHFLIVLVFVIAIIFLGVWALGKRR